MRIFLSNIWSGCSRSARNFCFTRQLVVTLTFVFLQRYERLIEAVKLLQEDLRLERTKLKRLLSRQIYADVARLVLFVAGSLAVLTVFQPDFPSALTDYVYSEVEKVGYSIW